MNVTWALLAVLVLVGRAEPRCSPTSYYKNCWIRRFPGIFIDVQESQRRGAQLLRVYQEESALSCSRTCCLTRNFSCNLAIFHYDTTQENCFHLHCPTLESCILSHRGNVVLFNVTDGVDPDLLVFGKYFTSNVRVSPHHYTRLNASEPLPSDKRHFYHPPPPAAPPLTSAPTGEPPTTGSRALTSTSAGRRALTSTTTGSRALTSTSSTTGSRELTSTSSTTVSRALTSTSTGSRVITSNPSTTRSSALTSTSTGSRVLTSTSTSSTTSDMTPLQSTSQGSTSSPPQPPSASPQSSPTSLPPVPPPSSALTTLTPDDPSFAPTAEQPSTPSTHHHITTLSPSASSPPTTAAGVMKSSRSKSTKGTLGRNQTAGSDGGQGVSGLGPGWHVAANTALVALAVGVSLLLSCCCSVLLAVSWRGQRRRMGRYRTSWRGTRGSMRLIKYVLVREHT